MAVDMTLTFGKYNGKKMSEGPLSYVQWLSEQSTICGKAAIPQTAKAFLACQSASPKQQEQPRKPEVQTSASHVHGKFCKYCREVIHGEAVPVQTHMESNGNRYDYRTYYLHPSCAQQGAEED